jgi:DNA-binding MarR family transcriptional regulator
MTHAEPLASVLQEWIGIVMHRSMRSMIRYMKENDLSASQIGALFQIHHGRSNISDLAERLGITTAAASQMLERLVQQDIIRRSEDPEDRRAKRLVLTEKGQRILRESIQIRRGWLEELASALSFNEKQQVIAAMRLLIERARKLDQEPDPVR